MIETERLLLRPYRLDDLAAYHPMLGEPAVHRYLSGGPLSLEDARNRLFRYAGQWALLGHGMFAVFDRATGGYVGETGIMDFGRGLGPRFDGFGEAAWVFATAAQGAGYATEAAVAAREWYRQRIADGRTVCLIDPDNAASLRLASRLGYRPFGRCDYRGRPAVMLESD